MPGSSNSFIILNSVDSTNNYAMGLLRTPVAVHGLAVFAREQTAGKGRRGKVWTSNRDENIMLSIAVDTQHSSLLHQFKISVVAALGAFDFLNKYCREKIKIKWPNDLFWNDRKAGGILIENIINGGLWQWAVIGIGININQTNFPEANYNAVSLKQVTGKTYEVIDLAKELRLNIMARHEQLKNNDFEKMIKEYNQNLFCMNEKVKLRKGNIVFETTVKGVSPHGELITMDATERRFGFDEVEWILAKR